MKVLILAKSTKKSQDIKERALCFAGIDLDTNKLVSSVADEKGEQIKKDDF